MNNVNALEHKKNQALLIIETVKESEEERAEMAMAVNDLVAINHGCMFGMGWWSDKQGKPLELTREFIMSKLMLVVTEIAEATEGIRKDVNDDHLPHRKMFEVELADAVIRIFDLAGATGINLGDALAEKLAYNLNRADHKPENRFAEGGKAV